MGTHIHVYLDHNLPRFDDVNETVERLNGVLPTALDVRDYWRLVDPSARRNEEVWKAEPIDARLADKRMFYGPGALGLWVMKSTAKIHTGGRWRGFLSIEPLRRVHLAAFRDIAQAMGSAKMALCADSQDEPWDVFRAGGSQDECIAALRTALGPPQPSVDSIAPDVVAQVEHGVPSVWFLETIPAAAK